MKIRPVAKAAPSPIPTAAEAAANPSLLEAAPRRAPRGAGALLGAGLLGGLFAPAAGGTESAPPPEVPALDAERAADAEAAARAEEAREVYPIVVGPILRQAMEEDGRGYFGCLAIDPPCVFSESEALDLIRQEFAKAGVDLLPDRELAGFASNRPDRDKEEENPPAAGEGSGRWRFDLGTEDGTLFVEFLSRLDAIALREEKEPYVAMDCPDLPACSERVREMMFSRTNGPPATIGLFFDPLVNIRLSEADSRNWPLDGKAVQAHEAAERKLAQLKLREQVRFFLDWARKEGRLPGHNTEEGESE
jgi:hypothetical protein